jgi:hypothetical protein
METLYIRVSSQNSEQDHDVKVANKFFENVTEFKCLGKTVAN